MKKIIISVLCLFGIAYSASSQGHWEKSILSDKELSEYLVYKSRQQRKWTVISLISGPIVTVAGAKLYNNFGRISQNGFDIAYIITGIGVVTTISSIPLFISSVKNNRQAKMLLKSESVSLNRKTIQIASFSIVYCL